MLFTKKELKCGVSGEEYSVQGLSAGALYHVRILLCPDPHQTPILFSWAAGEGLRQVQKLVETYAV